MADANLVLNGEIWVDVVGYEGIYKVSNLGRVLSLPKKTRNHHIVLKTPANYKTGYLFVDLCKVGYVNRHSSVHRIVAIAFLPNPDDKIQVNHIDGNKKNNRLDNLEWATRSENQQHAYNTGLASAKGVKNSQVKLTEAKVVAIRELIRLGTLKHAQIAEAFDVSNVTISDIKRGRSWSHI